MPLHLDVPTFTNGGGLVLALVVLVAVACAVRIVREALAKRAWKRSH